VLAGIYNADPETLSLRATMPRFLEMEERHRSVILGLLRARRAPDATRCGVSGARYSLFVTLKRGLQTLTDRLAGTLPGGALRLGAKVSHLDRIPPAGFRLATYQGRTIDADAVVLAMPAWAAGLLV